MDVKDKIIQTLLHIESRISNVKSDWYIIGSSAMILAGVDIENTLDIDILTTDAGSNEFKSALFDYKELEPQTKENELFHSNFARFSLPLMEIEVMRNLQINKNNSWQDVSVTYWDEIPLGNMKIKIPTRDEMKRLLLLFGREKDLTRMQLFQQC